MSKLLRGAPVRDAIAEQIHREADALREQGIRAKVATLRVGENSGDV